MIKVAIVAGHGMGNVESNRFDPGFTVKRGKEIVRECDVTLEMALTGKFVLIENGIPVHLIRSNNEENLPLRLRAPMATRSGCTHLIDLHMNSGGIPYVTSGTETFWDDERDLPFAQMVQACAVSAFRRRNRGVKHESLSPRRQLGILNFPKKAALLEMGFLHNPADLAAVKSAERRIAFWTAFAENLLEMENG